MALGRSLELQRIMQEALPEAKAIPIPKGIQNITKESWKTFEVLVLSGVNPGTAAERAFRITPRAFKKYMTDGQSGLDGSVLHEFYSAVRSVVSAARSIAEARVFYTDPLPWLEKMGGKDTSEPDLPTWGDAPTSTVNVNLFDVDVNFGPKGAETRLVPVEDITTVTK